MEQTTIVQLGAGPLMTHSIRLLKNAGFRVCTVDRNANAPGFGAADGHAVVDIVDADGVTRYAQEVGAKLILAVNEAGVLTAADASRRLGLPSLSPEVALRCLDKGLMREHWRKAGMPQPAFRVVDKSDDIPLAAAELGYPLVIKPALNWGSRGVSRVADAGELSWAVDFARTHCRNSRYVVEQFVLGTEMTVEGLVQQGEAQVLAKSDKEPQPHPRYRVAMALNYPAHFGNTQLQMADRIVAQAALALGIRDGAFHCECLINETGVYLVELGARGGGGHIFGQIVEAVSGVCMPVALAHVLLGEQVDIRPRHQRGACYKFFTPPPGVFMEVKGVDEARRLPGILDFGFSLKPGSVVDAVAGDADRPGYVVAVGATREEAMANADRAITTMRFVMAPANSGGKAA